MTIVIHNLQKVLWIFRQIQFHVHMQKSGFPNTVLTVELLTHGAICPRTSSTQALVNYQLAKHTMIVTL